MVYMWFDWQRDSARRFVLHFGCAALLLLALVATMNFLLNPEDIYPPQLRPAIKMNSRRVKTRLSAAHMGKAQALILGSSRSMKLDPSEVQRLTGLETFNAAVDLATPEDEYALLRLVVEEHKSALKLLIVGVEVETFDDRPPIDENLLHSTQLRSYLAPADTGHYAWKGFTELLSSRQTLLSLRSLSLFVLRYPPPLVHFDQNGYLHYDQFEKQKSQGKFDLPSQVNQWIERSGSLSGYRLSERRLAYFERVLKYAHDRGIRTVVFFTPMHPALLHAARSHGYDPLHEELGQRLARLCAANSAELL